MKIGDLLNYIQENIDDGCLTLDSEVSIIDEWGDTQPVRDVINDMGDLALKVPQ